jgi:hypothetical protein
VPAASGVHPRSGSAADLDLGARGARPAGERGRRCLGRDRVAGRQAHRTEAVGQDGLGGDERVGVERRSLELRLERAELVRAAFGGVVVSGQQEEARRLAREAEPVAGGRQLPVGCEGRVVQLGEDRVEGMLDGPQVASRRAGADRGRLEDRHRGTALGEMDRRGTADDPGADDGDIRLLHRSARRKAR